jgi:hypothetical protein
MDEWTPPFAMGGLFGASTWAPPVGEFKIIISEDDSKQLSWAKLPSHPHIADAKIDCDGWIIFWSEYGKHSAFGWQVEHIVPRALGGSDEMSNLRARHWDRS